eukprot:gene12322-7161_t
MLLGFNLVVTAPPLSPCMVGGWTLFGFASTFLIGMYNDRPTVQTNVTYVFAAYCLGDLAMLTAGARRCSRRALREWRRSEERG